jgi:predicted acylesterase/phospholipase RssA
VSVNANTVLVLEGGGLRGAFVAGALGELATCEGLRFSHIFATSAAAASAAYMVAGQIDRGIQIWRDRTHGGQLISARHLLRGRGLMDIEGLIEVFRGELSLDAARVELSTTALRVAVTNCNTGGADHVTATRANVYELLKATMALPVVYGRVVPVDGVPYIDGGVADAIPLEAALELAPARIIVVTTRPSGYRKARVRQPLGKIQPGDRQARGPGESRQRAGDPPTRRAAGVAHDARSGPHPGDAIARPECGAALSRARGAWNLSGLVACPGAPACLVRGEQDQLRAGRRRTRGRPAPPPSRPGRSGACGLP